MKNKVHEDAYSTNSFLTYKPDGSPQDKQTVKSSNLYILISFFPKEKYRRTNVIIFGILSNSFLKSFLKQDDLQITERTVIKKQTAKLTLWRRRNDATNRQMQFLYNHRRLISSLVSVRKEKTTLLEKCFLWLCWHISARTNLFHSTFSDWWKLWVQQWTRSVSSVPFFLDFVALCSTS